MINPDPKMIAQLNLLSDLIGGNNAGDSSRSGLLKLSLFDDDDDEDNPPPKRPPASSSTTASRQQPKNEDVTIDVSKVIDRSELALNDLILLACT